MNTQMDFGKVAVLMGGHSAERKISLQSGTAVLAALQRQGVDAHAVDPKESDLCRLADSGYDRVFNMLHGRGGEDGRVQALLELIGLPYTGSGVLGSALSMDKVRSKLMWMGQNLPTPDAVILRQERDLDAAAELGFPLMIKPAHEGSSIGMTKVTGPDQLAPAWEDAAQYDSDVLAEQFVEGAEYTVAIVGGEVMPSLRLVTPRSFYDYEAKYLAESTRYHCPSGLNDEAESALRELAFIAFTVLGCSGWGRVDFMLDGQGSPWLIEVNTVPGMTDHSLVPMAAKQAGYDFDQLVLAILSTSLDQETRQ